MGEPTRISYLTEDPAPRYAEGLMRAANPKALRLFLHEWPTLAPDAREAAKTVTANNWAEWLRGLQRERSGEFAGEAWAERFGAILMPARMLQATMVAEQFQVPWGLAWMRLKETGTLHDPAPAATEAERE